MLIKMLNFSVEIHKFEDEQYLVLVYKDSHLVLDVTGKKEDINSGVLSFLGVLIDED